MHLAKIEKTAAVACGACKLKVVGNVNRNIKTFLGGGIGFFVLKREIASRAFRITTRAV